MLKHILLFLAVPILFSCSTNTQEVNLQKQIETDTSKIATPILFSNPRVVDSSHIVIYPLILEKTSYNGSFSSGSEREVTSYWNLIFYNTDNNNQHLLTTDKKIVIYSFTFNGHSSSSFNDGEMEDINIYKKNIFYNVVSNDFNQNKYLDNDDPTYLYVSDKQGNNFRQLSPDNYNIVSWEIVKGTSKIILAAQKDNNGDKKFNNDDQVVPMIVDVISEKVAAEVFSQSYIDSLKGTLSSTWKISKK